VAPLSRYHGSQPLEPGVDVRRLCPRQVWFNRAFAADHLGQLKPPGAASPDAAEIAYEGPALFDEARLPIDGYYASLSSIVALAASRCCFQTGPP
jgi:hypothetical protein